MNKYELAKTLNEKYGDKTHFRFKDFEEMVDNIFNTYILDEIKNGKDVYIPRFGKFLPVTKSARKARNPSNNTIVEVPEKLSIRFKPSINLKNSLKEQTEARKE